MKQVDWTLVETNIFEPGWNIAEPKHLFGNDKVFADWLEPLDKIRFICILKSTSEYVRFAEVYCNYRILHWEKYDKYLIHIKCLRKQEAEKYLSRFENVCGKYDDDEHFKLLNQTGIFSRQIVLMMDMNRTKAWFKFPRRLSIKLCPKHLKLKRLVRNRIYK